VISWVTSGNDVAYAWRFGQAKVGQAAPESTDTFWHGDLAELIVYDRALTPAEVVAVEDYLNARYHLFVR